MGNQIKAQYQSPLVILILIIKRDDASNYHNHIIIFSISNKCGKKSKEIG